jgi:hypothetical protein
LAPATALPNHQRVPVPTNDSNKNIAYFKFSLFHSGAGKSAERSLPIRSLTSGGVAIDTDSHIKRYLRALQQKYFLQLEIPDKVGYPRSHDFQGNPRSTNGWQAAWLHRLSAYHTQGMPGRRH